MRDEFYTKIVYDHDHNKLKMHNYFYTYENDDSRPYELLETRHTWGKYH